MWPVLPSEVDETDDSCSHRLFVLENKLTSNEFDIISVPRFVDEVMCCFRCETIPVATV